MDLLCDCEIFANLYLKALVEPSSWTVFTMSWCGNGWCSCRGAIRAKGATNDGSVISGIRTGHRHTGHQDHTTAGGCKIFQLSAFKVQNSDIRSRLFGFELYIPDKKKLRPFNSCDFFSSFSVCGQLAIGPRSLLSGLHLYCHETRHTHPSPAQPHITHFLLNHEHFSPRAEGSMRGAGRRESEKRC